MKQKQPINIDTQQIKVANHHIETCRYIVKLVKMITRFYSSYTKKKIIREKMITKF